MCIRDRSVIAAASKAAKIAKLHGGFTAKVEGNISIGQIQVLDINIQESISIINSNSNDIIELANTASKTLPKLGKGAKKVQCKEIKTSSSSMLIVELMIDVGDAMGANVTNTMCEIVAPLIEKLTNGKTLLRLSLIHI